MTGVMTLDHVLEHQGYTSLPLQRTSVGHMAIDAVVNGQVARFLVDTGASATVLDRASAERWSLPVVEGAASAAGCVGGAGAASVEGQATKVMVKELRLASVRLADLEMYVVDFAHVNAALEQNNAPRIDGVIGADILDAREAVITYMPRTLHLRV